jgi:hypothetical protein
VLYTIFILIIFVVCGLDAGRFQLSSPGMGFLVGGVIIFFVG